MPELQPIPGLACWPFFQPRSTNVQTARRAPGRYPAWAEEHARRCDNLRTENDQLRPGRRKREADPLAARRSHPRNPAWRTVHRCENTQMANKTKLAADCARLLSQFSMAVPGPQAEVG